MAKISFLVPDITLKGGLERFVANSCFALSGWHEIEIISIFKSNSVVLYDIPVGVKVTYLSGKRFAWHYRLLSLYFLMRSKRYIDELSDVIISTSPFIAIILLLLNKRLGLKMIASEHSTYDAHKGYVAGLRTLMYKHVRHIVTQTDSGVAAFRADGMLALKIPNSVANFTSPLQWHEKSIENQPQYNILTVGRFEKVKQHAHLIKAVKQVKCSRSISLRFLLVGSGPLYHEYIDLIAKENVGNSIEIIHSTPDIFKYYEKAHVFVMCSESEAFPMTVIEALSFGIPVVSYSGLIGPAEIIQDGREGFFAKQDDIDDLASCISRAVENPLNYSLLSQNAVESAKRYSEDNVSKIWNDLFKQY